MILTTTNSHWQELQAAVQGAVIRPADPGYDEARLAWNRRVDQHPAVIIVVKNAEDVATAVQAANHHNLKVAIQATGHGNIRPADDCMLILTSAMDGVTIDAQAQTAWVEAGVKWGTVLEKAQAVGLAPLLGSAPHVGVVGYTLGGGMGWLARKYGLSDQGQWLTDVQCGCHRPLTGAFLAGRIENPVEHRFSVFIVISENITGDFN